MHGKQKQKHNGQFSVGDNNFCILNAFIEIKYPY